MARASSKAAQVVSVYPFLDDDDQHTSEGSIWTRWVDTAKRASHRSTLPRFQSYKSEEQAVQAIPTLIGDARGLHTTFPGADAFSLEHVAVSVHGMTCTGCESKLHRILDATPGISDVSISLLNSRANFQVDKRRCNLDKLMSHIHSTTGFTVKRIGRDYPIVDVLVEASPATEASLKQIAGVLDVTFIDKHTVRLTYDAQVVGIRDLLQRMGGNTRCLAPSSRVVAGSSDATKMQNNMAAKTIASAVLTIPVLIFAWARTGVEEKTASTASLILATCVQFIAASEFYRDAYTTLRYAKSIDLDMPVVVSVTSAYVYSVVVYAFLLAGRPLNSESFFETSTLLTTLVLVGRLLSTIARTKAVAAVSVRALQSQTAWLINEDGTADEIDARLLQHGDRFLVKPYTSIPTDGIITAGQGEVDESMLTGESMPVPKSPGSDLIAGTVNGSGTLEARLTRLPCQSTIADIAGLVEQASANKTKVQTLAARIAKWFLPAIALAALLSFTAWLVAGMKLQHLRPGSAAGKALTYSIAVLAVSCPCALVLAVPMVLVTTGGIAARAGVVIKAADTVERCWDMTDVVFDKTGTLTLPGLVVTDEYLARGDAEWARGTTLGVVRNNRHPVSAGVESYLKEKDVTGCQVARVETIPGKGVRAMAEGAMVEAGHPDWLAQANHPIVQRLTAAERSILCVTSDSALVAIFGLKTSLRPQAKSVIDELKIQGKTIHLLSGDAEPAVRACAQALEIPPENVRFRCSPAEKRDYVQRLSNATCNTACDSDTEAAKGRQACGNHHDSHDNEMKKRAKKVIFIGDSTNDAPAMSASAIGVQIGSISDVLTSSASSVALTGGLNGVLHLFELSRAAHWRIKFNFAWSLVYNLFAVLLAAGAFVKVRIAPSWAGLGELVSLAPVVGVGMSMLWSRPGYRSGRRRAASK